MNSGTAGQKNDRGEYIISKPDTKSTEEKRLLKLLALVSDKINERFIDLKSCFRFLDTDHTLSISLNEFAQAIDHMRLKISFDDIKQLFDYLDKKGRGAIGYDDFTLLLEERWRGIDPIELVKSKMKQQHNPMSTSEKPILNIYDNCQSELQMIQKLEALARDRLKVPLVREKELGDNMKISRNDSNNLDIAKAIPVVTGIIKNTNNQMSDVIKHDYLRRSMEQRV